MKVPLYRSLALTDRTEGGKKMKEEPGKGDG